MKENFYTTVSNDNLKEEEDVKLTKCYEVKMDDHDSNEITSNITPTVASPYATINTNTKNNYES